MKQNKFDLAMAYIDANVAEPIEDIKMGIAKTIGMPIHHFMMGLPALNAKITSSLQKCL